MTKALNCQTSKIMSNQNQMMIVEANYGEVAGPSTAPPAPSMQDDSGKGKGRGKGKAASANETKNKSNKNQAQFRQRTPFLPPHSDYYCYYYFLPFPQGPLGTRNALRREAPKVTSPRA